MPSAKIVKKGTGELKNRITVKLFQSGEYTFSAYLKTSGLTVASGHKGAFLRATANGNVYTHSNKESFSPADKMIADHKNLKSIIVTICSL